VHQVDLLSFALLSIELAVIEGVHVSIHELLEDLLLLEEQVADSLEVFDRNFCIFAALQNVLVIVPGLSFIGYLWKFVFLHFFFGWLDEAFNG
jgi:hypothetical protein